MAEVTAIRAAHVDGRELSKADLGLAHPRAVEGLLGALVEIGAEGSVSVEVQPERGEQIRVFTRRGLAGGLGSQPIQEIPGTAVIEVIPDPARPDRFVRLYVGPAGVLLSTREH